MRLAGREGIRATASCESGEGPFLLPELFIRVWDSRSTKAAAQKLRAPGPKAPGMITAAEAEGMPGSPKLVG